MRVQAAWVRPFPTLYNMKTTAAWTLDDRELGIIDVHPHVRARRITFRAKEGGVRATVPPGVTPGEVRKAVDELRPRLLLLLRKSPRTVIDWDYRLDGELFSLRLLPGEDGRFLSRNLDGEVQIICPKETDFSTEAIQQWLRRVVTEALRRRAKVLLPPRLRALSVAHGLPFRSVKVNSSMGRWGSCSGRGDINLSCHLLRLPARLVDYVLLHELAHTREMNHGPRFHALLDSLTGGREKSLLSELKRYKPEI